MWEIVKQVFYFWILMYNVKENSKKMENLKRDDYFKMFK